MKWSWDKLRHKNVTGGDCQVVTAVNAYHVLTGEVAYKTERGYLSLCKRAKAEYGSAITIEKVHRKLGIEQCKPRRHPFSLNVELPTRLQRPIEVSVWHKHYGFHSILIVDVCRKTDAVRVTNFGYVTSLQGWIFIEDLKPHIANYPSRPFVARTFRPRRTT